MGCWVTKSHRGTLTFRLYYRGERWGEGTGQPYTEKSAEKAKRFAALVEESMQRGLFVADYERFFPGGNRIDKWGRKPTSDAGVTLREFAKAVVESRVAPLYRAGYAQTASTHLGHWILPTLGHMRLAAITREHVIALRTRILVKRSVKHAHNVIATLQSILGEAVARHHVSENVAARLDWPAPARRDRVDPFSHAEVERILGAFSVSRPRLYPLILCLADTGMRPCEATGLEWGDVVLTGHGRIQIRRSFVRGSLFGAPKTSASFRTLDRLTPRLIAALEEIQPRDPKPGDAVFVGEGGSRLRQERVQQRQFAPLVEGDLKLRRRSMYQLRHSWASRALSADPPANPQFVSEYLGTSLKMLRDHYARFMQDASGRDPLEFLIGPHEAKVYQLPARSPSPARGRRG